MKTLLIAAVTLAGCAADTGDPWGDVPSHPDRETPAACYYQEPYQTCYACNISVSICDRQWVFCNAEDREGTGCWVTWSEGTQLLKCVAEPPDTDLCG